MSVPMELDDPATEAVPLDLTVKKENDSAGSAAVKKRDGPAEESAGDAPPPSNDQNGGKPTPLDLSAGRTLSSQAPPQPPPSSSSANVAQRATVVVMSPKVQIAPPPPPPSPPPKSQPPCKGYWTPDSSSPLMPEHLAPLHGIYADAAAYRHMISSATVPEYNPFLPVLPPSAQFHHHNHFQQQQQQQHLHIQQQHQLHLQQQLQLQLQMQQQQQHHQEQQQKLQKQKLQLQAAYGGLPIDPALLLTGSPVYAATSSPSSSESNHFPFGGFDCGFSKPPFGFGYPYYERMLDGRVIGGACGGIDISANRSDCPSPESTTTCTTTTDDHHHFNHHHHQQQQQRDLDREHHHRIKACDMDDLDVVDPEEVAAIYRQSDFLSFRHRYIESLGPPRNFEKMRRSSNNNNSSSSSNNNDDHRMTSGQQQYDQTYVMKRQKNNEAAKRSRDAKRQKYIENQISVMYLTKKVSEMKDIKRRLLKSM